jgi:ABC-type sugar transport system ATPase subunit
MPLLEVRDVTKQFPGVRALQSVNLDIERRSVHALVGENGAGKSTLVKIISGALRPDGGQLLFDNRRIAEFTPGAAADAGIAVVYQRQQLVSELSAAENILLGRQPARFGGLAVSRRETLTIAAQLLERLRVELDPTLPVRRLSPAQQQEVAIAKALYRRARLLILDEPTAALDPAQIERLFELVRDLTAQGVSVLYISHHLEEVFALADTVTVLRDGAVVTTQPARALTQNGVVAMMAGRAEKSVSAAALAAAQIAGSDDPSDIILEIKNLAASPGLRGVDLTLRRGEVLGITGNIGSGGHELAQLLFGLRQPSAGGMCFAGAPYAPRAPREAIRRGVFLLPENPARDGLVGRLSVAQNITLIDLRAITRAGFLELGRERELAREYVRRLHVATSSVEREVRTLSGGNQQKVLLAKGLQGRARLLVLEEPTQGVDVNAKTEIHTIVRDFAAAGPSVIVVSTDIRDLLLFTDRIVVFRAGTIVGECVSRRSDYASVLNLSLGSLEFGT